MLSFFPELYDWSWYVPFFFRIFLAWYFISVGYAFAKQGDDEHSKDRLVWAIWGALLVGVGVSFLIGVFIQFAGVIGFSFGMLAMGVKRFHTFYERYTRESFAFYGLLSLVSLSMVFLGPGPFAVDLPL